MTQQWAVVHDPNRTEEQLLFLTYVSPLNRAKVYDLLDGAHSCDCRACTLCFYNFLGSARDVPRSGETIPMPEVKEPRGEPEWNDAILERTAQLVAHRVCCGSEHDAANGKLHGNCIVCGVAWPCDYAGTPPAKQVDVPAASDACPSCGELEPDPIEGGRCLACGTMLFGEYREPTPLDDAPAGAPASNSIVSASIPGDPKRISAREFRDEGYLQEMNRRFLHPLGLALELVIDDDGEARFGSCWDYRDDPEGIFFAGLEKASAIEKAERIDALWDARMTVRHNTLGYVIQPVEDLTK